MKRTSCLLIFTACLLLCACSTSVQTAQPAAVPTCPVCAEPQGEVTSVVVLQYPTPAAPTATPDPCAAENIESSVEEVHSFMREFDDASALAGSVAREELADHVANMQRIRRESEDQYVPVCLADLKSYQLSHMNVVINTLIAFMGGSDQDTVDQGIELARQYHDEYTLELANVLDLDVVSVDTSPTQTAAP